MTVNLDRLREALDARGTTWHSSADSMGKAAKAVADAPRVWWCSVHRASATEFGECARATIERMAMSTPVACERIRVALAPVEEGET